MRRAGVCSPAHAAFVVTAGLVPLKHGTCAEDIRLCFGSFADTRTH